MPCPRPGVARVLFSLLCLGVPNTKTTLKMLQPPSVPRSSQSTGENALRMLCKTSWRGEQVTARHAVGYDSTDRCQWARAALSARSRRARRPGGSGRVPRRGLSGERYPAWPRGHPPRLPARGAQCPRRGGGAQPSPSVQGFLEAEPAAPSCRSSPVPRAHDAHFQGRHCHGRAGTLQPRPCLSGWLPASTSSAQLAAAPGDPALDRLSANGHGHPTRAPGATADSQEDPPRHSQEPLRRLSLAGLPGRSCAPRSCPRHVGTCSPHPCLCAPRDSSSRRATCRPKRAWRPSSPQSRPDPARTGLLHTSFSLRGRGCNVEPREA
jgi:hypothetical protein